MIPRDELTRLGTDPEALLAIEPAVGYYWSGGFEGERFVAPTDRRGAHGYLPTNPLMHTGLILSGAGVVPGLSIPFVRQVDIAPTIALARAHYRLGDRERAAEEAEAALTADPAFLRSAEYDGVSGPTNSMQGLLTTATNNFQPLPRLDFLDPKFYVRGPDIESPLPVLVISGTSVDHEQIAAIESIEEGLYVLYLIRQEIFIAEGRRTVDLGIRFPVALREVQSNPHAEDGASYTQAQVPAFIPPSFGMNTFDYDEEAGTVVIHHDLNRALVENRSSHAVLPFHD